MYMIEYKIKSFDKEKVWLAGPYTTYEDAELHYESIGGHKGVSDCEIVELNSSEGRQVKV